MRLIDADELIEVLDERYINACIQSLTRSGRAKTLHYGIASGVNFARNAINEQPTIDAVEVVRCKDCRYFMPKANGTVGFCKCGEVVGYHPMMRVANVFCFYGKRKGYNAAD